MLRQRSRHYRLRLVHRPFPLLAHRVGVVTPAEGALVGAADHTAQLTTKWGSYDAAIVSTELATIFETIEAANESTK